MKNANYHCVFAVFRSYLYPKYEFWHSATHILLTLSLQTVKCKRKTTFLISENKQKRKRPNNTDKSKLVLTFTNERPLMNAIIINVIDFCPQTFGSSILNTSM